MVFLPVQCMLAMQLLQQKPQLLYTVTRALQRLFLAQYQMVSGGFTLWGVWNPEDLVNSYYESLSCQLLYSLTNAATSLLPKVKTSDAVRLLTFRQTAFEVRVAQSTTRFPCHKVKRRRDLLEREWCFSGVVSELPAWVEHFHLQGIIRLALSIRLGAGAVCTEEGVQRHAETYTVIYIKLYSLYIVIYNNIHIYIYIIIYIYI